MNLKMEFGWAFNAGGGVERLSNFDFILVFVFIITFIECLGSNTGKLGVQNGSKEAKKLQHETSWAHNLTRQKAAQ